MENPYETLGIERDATAEDVKRAYRQRAKQAHPDTAGGSKKEFLKLQRALAVLSDPDKRKRYDSSGVMDEDMPDNTEAQSINVLVGFFVQALNEFEAARGDIFQVDIVQICKNWMNEQITTLNKRKQQNDVIRDKLARIEKRLRKKQGGKATLNVALKVHAQQLALSNTGIDTQINAYKEALKVIDDYVFDKDVAMAMLGGYTLFRAI